MSGLTLQLARGGFSLAFGATGLYLAAAARRLFIGQRDWIRHGVTTEGQVVAIKMESPTNEVARRKFYAPVVAFRTASGEQRQFTSALSSEAQRFDVGQTVTVRYLADNLDRVDLDELTHLWWPLAALIVATIVTLVIASLPFLLDSPLS
jgi:hypothetical protein